MTERESLFQSRAYRIQVEKMEDGTYYATAYDEAGQGFGGSGRVATPMEALSMLGGDVSGEHLRDGRRMNWQDVSGMEHLRDDAPFLVCTDCERKSWSSKVGDGCGLLQPDGSRCVGTFRARGE